MKSTGPLWSEKTHSCLSLSCAVTARLHKPRPPQVLSPCTFSLGSPPFLTASLNHSSAWNLPQRWQIMDYLTSLGKCCKNNQKKKRYLECDGLFFPCTVWVPAWWCCPLIIGPLHCFVPFPAAATLMEPSPTGWGDESQGQDKDFSSATIRKPLPW